MQPRFVDIGQRQRQREGQRRRTAGGQVAEVDGQRLVAERKRIGIGKKMPAFDQHVAGNRQLRAWRGLEQRAVVAHAQHGARRGAREVTRNQVKFTHGGKHTASDSTAARGRALPGQERLQRLFSAEKYIFYKSLECPRVALAVNAMLFNTHPAE